jgi:SulP family sulfate permease
MLKQIWKKTSVYFARPFTLLFGYQWENLQPDVTAALTVTIVLLPQALAYAMIAELPPRMGLYSAMVAAIVGALWGSSNHLHTGPTNTSALLVLSVLVSIAEPGSRQFLAAASLMAVFVGVFRLVLGLARLGMLVNFVSDSVVIGFTAGAGVLIGVNQLRHLLRLDIPNSPSFLITLQTIIENFDQSHLLSLLFGVCLILFIALLQYFRSGWPVHLFAMILAGGTVAVFGLQEQGIEVIGELPRNLPPLSTFSVDLAFLGDLATGALAVGAIGLVEAIAISRSIASQSGQRLDSNQEFVGQGLANIACGIFSGFPVSGSFTRSQVNYEAGAKSSLASLFSGIFVTVAVLIFGPLTAYVPRTALAAVLMVTAYSMIDRVEIARIWRGTPSDAFIMVVTFLSTLFLPLQFAVLTGILISLAIYIYQTSAPQVVPVTPARDYHHFTHQPERAPCTQLAVFNILGDLYFGATNHITESIRKYIEEHPNHRFLLLRMNSVHQVDISGIHALETIVEMMRERGGDVYIMRVRQPVLETMKTTGFHDFLGADHFLRYEDAVSFLFHHVMDPAVCIYECNQRVFKECQNLPRPIEHPLETPIQTELPTDEVPSVTPRQLWQALQKENPPLVVDVREPREFNQRHIPGAISMPLFKLLSDPSQLPRDEALIFVCQSGRRSKRATYLLRNQGYENAKFIEGGLLAWEAADLLTAIEKQADDE